MLFRTVAQEVPVVRAVVVLDLITLQEHLAQQIPEEAVAVEVMVVAHPNRMQAQAAPVLSSCVT